MARLLALLTLAVLSLSTLASALSINVRGRSVPLLVQGNTGSPFLITSESIHDCGQPTDLFHPTSIDINPDPPRRGEELVVDVKGTLDETVAAGAYADVTVKLGLIKLLDTRLNLCDEITKIDRECPIEKGPVDINTTVKIPGELPPGYYKVHLQAYNYDDKPIACIDAGFRL
ncbi:Phosphatidylglycerol/phosphatidylinositol transfer protein [Thoreauomyces humboldtii]|nr:Phosphatidylglycerol/phosphatidylinositol transfer protein [Thoreauomyces humboldtii]